MAARSDTHPSAETLRAFGLGKLDDLLAETVMGHLDTCADCREEVASQSGDTFLERLRQAQSRGGTPLPGKSLSELARSLRTTASLPEPMSTAPGLPPELVKNQQYEVLRELGRGGMGVVYLARHKLSGRQEVLKVMNKDVLTRPGSKERFLREIQTAARLDHPNIVKMYTAIELGELLVLVIEYVPGTDLDTAVKQNGPVPVTNACYYIQQAALGLQHAWEKGMVHRDVKPQNLILSQDKKKQVVRILDFGLAKATSEKGMDPGLTGEGKMLGTPHYMAPEQIRDAAKADIRADIYSLGCTLHFLLRAETPFTGKSLYDILEAHQLVEARPLNLIRPEVPEELAAVVRKMMAKDSAKRFQTPLEVARALAPFIKPGTKEVTPPAKLGRSLSMGTAVASNQTKDAEAGRSVAPDIGKQTLGPRPASSAGEKNAPLRTQTLAQGSQLSFGDRAPRRRPPQAKASGGRKWFIGAATMVLLMAFLGLWAAGVFKVKTKNGTIVFEKLPSDAEVLVDGEKVTLTWGAGKTAEVTVQPGTRNIVATTREGLKLIGREVVIEDGKSVILACVDPPAKSSGKSQRDSNPADSAGVPGDAKADSVAVKSLSGRWEIKGDELVQKDSTAAPAVIEFGDARWQDHDFSADAMRETGSKSLGLLFRCVDLRNRYAVNFGAANNAWAVIVASKDGVYQELTGHKPIDLKDNAWHRILVKVRGQRFTVLVDEKQLFDIEDARLSAGMVGLHTLGAGFHFKNVRVTAPDGSLLWSGLPGATGSDASARATAPSRNPAEAVSASVSPQDTDFVPLFNGKDLTGWTRASSNPIDWIVDEQTLIGVNHGGPGTGGELVTERSGYANFHLRCETVLSEGLSCCLNLRHATSKPDEGVKTSYRVIIAGTQPPAAGQSAVITGSLAIQYQLVFSQPLAVAKDLHLKPGEWFKLEVIAIGPRFRVLINAVPVVDYEDPGDSLSGGAIGVTCRPGSKVRFRHLEIKELPPTPRLPPRRVGTLLKRWKSGFPAYSYWPDDWKVVDQEVQQINDGPGHRILLFGDRQWTDYDVVALVKSPAHPGVVYRADRVTEQGVFSVFMYGEGNGAEVFGFGPWQRVRTAPGNGEPNHWYKLTVKLRGPNCQCFVDDNLLYEYQDPLRLRGMVGLRTWSSTAAFRDVKVLAPDGSVLLEGLPAMPPKPINEMTD